jgi:hypothetical protein
VNTPFSGGGQPVSASAHDAPPLRPVPSVVVAEWPAGTFLENLAPSATHPGSWLVSIPSHNRIDRVDPDGKLDTPQDPTALYVTSTGGLLNPPEGGVQPARLVRLTLVR